MKNLTDEQARELQSEIDEDRMREDRQTYYDEDRRARGEKPCEFCSEWFLKEDLIKVAVDDGEISEICEDCKIKLLENQRE